jgi:hypothetical protein
VPKKSLKPEWQPKASSNILLQTELFNNAGNNHLGDGFVVLLVVEQILRILEFQMLVENLIQATQTTCSTTSLGEANGGDTSRTAMALNGKELHDEGESLESKG